MMIKVPSRFGVVAKRSMSTKKASSSVKSKLDLKGPMPTFKYFINESTVLGVYREALQICAKGFSDPAQAKDMADLIKHEFEPFRKFSGKTQASDEM